MINYKDLTFNQLLALDNMQHFDCKAIECEDCPLLTKSGQCGAVKAELIIGNYYKEIFHQ